MFVRVKKNRGGSYTVLLVEGIRIKGKKHATSRIIKNFGHSNSLEALNQLKQEALLYKEKIEKEIASREPLNISSNSDIKSCYDENIGLKMILDKYLDYTVLSDNTSSLVKNYFYNISFQILKNIFHTKSFLSIHFNDRNDLIYNLFGSLNKNPYLSNYEKIQTRYLSNDLGKIKNQKYNNQLFNISIFDISNLSSEYLGIDEFLINKINSMSSYLLLIEDNLGEIIDFKYINNLSSSNKQSDKINILTNNKIYLEIEYNIKKYQIKMVNLYFINKDLLNILDSKDIKYLAIENSKKLSKEIINKLLNIKQFKGEFEQIELNNNKYLIFKNNHHVKYMELNILNNSISNKLFSSHKEDRNNLNNSNYDLVKDTQKHIFMNFRNDEYLGDISNTRIMTNLDDPNDIISKNFDIFKLANKIEKSFKLLSLEIKKSKDDINYIILLLLNIFKILKKLQYDLAINGYNSNISKIGNLLKSINHTIITDSKGNIYSILQDFPEEAEIILSKLNLKLPNKFRYLK